MAINLTVAEVREFYPTSASDSKIQSFINVVIEKYGACLESSYSENTADVLAKSAVAIMLSNASSSSGQIKSKRAPNGSAVTYETGDQIDGSYNNIEALDSNRCLIDLIASKGVFLFGTMGSNLNV